MDIWAWVDEVYDELWESGHERLARLLYEIPNDLHNNEYSRIEATIPEAIAGARALKNPWLEVFFRHWSLRNRLSNYGEGATALNEAADLLDFAHQDSTSECPQSICVTQDLASCYGNIDGPNWVEERLAVCNETIARIGPDRNCFDCISREISSAHKDNKDYKTADKFLKEQAIIMRQAGNEPCGYYLSHQADLSMKMGNLEEAKAFLDEMKKGPLSESDSSALMLSYKMGMTHYYILTGNYEEAHKTFPEWSELSPGDHEEWFNIFALLVVDKPEINTWRLAAIMMDVIEKKKKMGVHRGVYNLIKQYINLALLRNAQTIAELALPQLKEAQALLRYPEKEDGVVAAIEAKVIGARKEVVLPVPADQILDHLKEMEDRNPEIELAWLQKAAEERLADIAIQSQYGYALGACRLYADTKKHLWKQIRENNHLATKDELVHHLLESSYAVSEAEWQKLVSELGGNYPKIVMEHKIIKTKNEGEWERLESLLAEGVSLGLDSLWLKRYLVFASKMQSKFEQAQVASVEIERFLKDELSKEQTPEVVEELRRHIRNVQWDIVAYSSAIQDWKQIHQIRDEVEIAVPDTNATTEKIRDEDFYQTAVYIRIYEDGEESYLYAYRDGPATARIITIGFDNTRQYANDWVAFDPTLIEPYPEDPEEQESFIASFDRLCVLEKGGKHAWSVYGPLENEDLYKQLLDTFTAEGWMIWIRVKEENFFYAQIAVPSTLSPQNVQSKLTELNKHWKNTLCYRALAEKTGIDLPAQEQLAEEYRKYF